MYVNFVSTYSDKKSCHTSITLQTSIARFVSFLLSFSMHYFLYGRPNRCCTKYPYNGDDDYEILPLRVGRLAVMYTYCSILFIALDFFS